MQRFGSQTFFRHLLCTRMKCCKPCVPTGGCGGPEQAAAGGQCPEEDGGDEGHGGDWLSPEVTAAGKLLISGSEDQNNMQSLLAMEMIHVLWADTRPRGSFTFTHLILLIGLRTGLWRLLFLILLYFYNLKVEFIIRCNVLWSLWKLSMVSYFEKESEVW